MDLLFVLALFHGLTKLRLSTPLTRDVLRSATADLGNHLRAFKTAAEKLRTEELDAEAEKRQKRQNRAAGKRREREAATAEHPKERVESSQDLRGGGRSTFEGGKDERLEGSQGANAKGKGRGKDMRQGADDGQRSAFEGSVDEQPEGPQGSKAKGKGRAKGAVDRLGGGGDDDDDDDDEWIDVADGARSSGTQPKKEKKFTMRTYKIHELGHYFETILRYGTLDIHSTQWVSRVSFISTGRY